MELTVGAFQFAASGDVRRNLGAVERGVVAAARRGVRLLVLQECALSGYPPLEVPLVEDIDANSVRSAEGAVAELAQVHSMYIASGTVVVGPDGARNVVRVARPTGTLSPGYVEWALY